QKITDNVEQGGAGPKGFSSYFVVPWGGGSNVKVSKRLDINGEITWHLTSDEFDLRVGGSNKDYYAYYSVGLVYKFNTKKRKVVSRVEKEPEVVAQDTAKPVLELAEPEPTPVAEPVVVEEPVYVPIVPVEVVKEEEAVPDLEFRVQIRASYGRPVTREELNKFGIPDEIMEEYSDGWYRYTVGSFDNLEDATDYRDLMRTTYDVYDAFVVAYLKGNRLRNLRYLDPEYKYTRYSILEEEKDNVRYGVQLKASYLRPMDIEAIADEFNLNEPIREDFQNDWYRYSVGDFSQYWKAKEYRNILLTRHNAQGSFVIAFEDDIRTTIIDLIGVQSGETPVAPSARPKADVIFYVQILCLDTYKRVPSDELNARYDIYNEIREVTEGGLIKYQIGGFTSYDEAKSVRSQMMDKGIYDAFIVPYINGVKITIKEAFE
ncbi:MAG: SPOR domain-containing protein, partial [Bacteroidota bacterium]|nr:SPOR domain-containing protein [Bacteroidota bacterium]